MKLRNKKTGETGYYLHTHRDHKYGVLKVAVLKDGMPFSEFKPYEPIYDYDSLVELNADWEDYEEPKEYWCIDCFSPDGLISEFTGSPSDILENRKSIGNYFETKEEAEKAAEKLKAAKRLKDKGFRFNSWYGGSKDISFSIPQEIIDKTTAKDLDLLFGGEE